MNRQFTNLADILPKVYEDNKANHQRLNLPRAM